MFDVVFKTTSSPLMFNYSTALSFPSSALSGEVERGKEKRGWKERGRDRERDDRGNGHMYFERDRGALYG